MLEELIGKKISLYQHRSNLHFWPPILLFSYPIVIIFLSYWLIALAILYTCLIRQTHNAPFLWCISHSFKTTKANPLPIHSLFFPFWALGQFKNGQHMSKNIHYIWNSHHGGTIILLKLYIKFESISEKYGFNAYYSTPF